MKRSWQMIAREGALGCVVSRFQVHLLVFSGLVRGLRLASRGRAASRYGLESKMYRTKATPVPRTTSVTACPRRRAKSPGPDSSSQSSSHGLRASGAPRRKASSRRVVSSSKQAPLSIPPPTLCWVLTNRLSFSSSFAVVSRFCRSNSSGVKSFPPLAQGRDRCSARYKRSAQWAICLRTALRFRRARRHEASVLEVPLKKHMSEATCMTRSRCRCPHFARLQPCSS
mmetsp:Transcript_32408/g.73259  ORF Transcript_32408/g.73259 Transcript_32408/m.73259 type:complete len:227 (-) Transcript_32408:1151-1831(-)